MSHGRVNHGTLARALCLVRHDLLDAGLTHASPVQAVQARLMAAGMRDETEARRAAQRATGHREPLIVELEHLCDAMARIESGRPVLADGVLPRQLSRLVAPEALFPFAPGLDPAPGDPFDWPDLPEPHDARLHDLLRDGSVDTHVHLGGSLPPVFYWIPLMGGGLHLDSLRSLSAMARGHATPERWQFEVACAAHRRLELAALLEWDRHADERLFPWIPEDLLFDFLDRPADPADPHTNPDALHRRVLELSMAVRPPSHTDDPLDFPFPDPLRRTATGVHYASGERRLLHAAGSHLRQLEEAGEDDWPFEGLLRNYLGVCHAFHHLLLHDRGYQGLLRFLESFGRRSFIFDTGGRRTGGRRGRSGGRRGRSRGRRRRGRQMIFDLERSRMTAALDAQLAPHSNAQAAAERSVEMRVSVPQLRDLVGTLDAWLEGLRRHLRPSIDGPCRNSRVGLLFHFIKWGDDTAAAEDARRTAERLRWALERYPGLRPFVVGVDAAGFERHSNPRTFARAFRTLKSWQHPPGEPPVNLGWTFHVGEDVDDFLTGLRHIDETLIFLLPEHPGGGRLGHALVLGDDPRHFYDRRGTPEPPVGVHLLDLLWARHLLAPPGSEGKSAESLLKWLDDRIECLGGVEAAELDTLLETPGHPRSERELLDIHFGGQIEDFSHPHPVDLDGPWFEILHRAQQHVRQRVAKAKICVEANPTSNLIIGGYAGYAQLPCNVLTDAGIPVSINTDDPGLFLTTLPGEFSMLLEGHGEAERLDWLRQRLADARQSTFLRQTPAGLEAWTSSCRIFQQSKSTHK